MASRIQGVAGVISYSEHGGIAQLGLGTYFDLRGWRNCLQREEAATIDGATLTQAFLLVLLPLARPALAVTALFGFLAGFGDFILANTVLFDAQKYTAPVGIFTLQEGYNNPWNWFAASALIISIPVTIVLYISSAVSCQVWLRVA